MSDITRFCEKPYNVVPEIREFWNSISNGVYIDLGIIILSQCYTYPYNNNITLMGILLIAVGLGSFLFHACDSKTCELLDELPMILMVITLVWAQNDKVYFLTDNRKKIFWKASSGLLAYETIKYIYYNNYNVFVDTFTVCSIITFLLAFSTKNLSKYAKLCRNTSFYEIILAKGFWEAERIMCPPESGGSKHYYHVIWHYLSALACYHFILYSMYLSKSDIHNPPPQKISYRINLINKMYLNPNNSSTKLKSQFIKFLAVHSTLFFIISNLFKN